MPTVQQFMCNGDI